MESGYSNDRKSLGWALKQLTAKAYPPDLGLLLATAKSRNTLNEIDVNKSLVRTLAAVSDRQLWLLTSQELYALKNYPGGWFELRNASSDMAIRKWAELLKMASLEINLPQAPLQPEGYIEKKCSRDIGEAAMMKIKTMLKKDNYQIL